MPADHAVPAPNMIGAPVTLAANLAAILDQAIRTAFEHGWMCRERVDNPDLEGAPATVVDAYTDWRAWGPGVTLPGGPDFRARTRRINNSWTGREFRPTPR